MVITYYWYRFLRYILVKTVGLSTSTVTHKQACKQWTCFSKWNLHSLTYQSHGKIVCKRKLFDCANKVVNYFTAKVRVKILTCTDNIGAKPSLLCQVTFVYLLLLHYLYYSSLRDLPYFPTYYIRSESTTTNNNWRAIK